MFQKIDEKVIIASPSSIIKQSELQSSNIELLLPIIPLGIAACTFSLLSR